ncbi:MAG: hypothetical protein WD271_16990, partial [Acidimicrobiia bacterium]
ARLDSTGAHDVRAVVVRGLLVDVATLPPHEPGWVTRVGSRLRGRYLRFTESGSFVVVVDGLLLLMAVAKVLFAVGLATDGRGIRGFAEWASVVSSLVAGVLIVIGAIRLRRSRLDALRWFDRGLLVEILVTQVFVFQQRQLEGLAGLVWTIVVWLLVRSAMTAERERVSLEAADSVAPAARAVS